jgi:hypothetical protein
MSFRINVVNDPKLDEYTHKRGDLLKQTSRSYTNEEMATVYQLYNSYNPQAKKSDTGCGSCRRQVLNFMTAKWHELDKKQKETNV